MPEFVVHNLCWACWYETQGDEVPALPFRMEGQKELCCMCDTETWSGIYVRAPFDFFDFDREHNPNHPLFQGVVG